jgi:hypothetical protein
MFKCFGEQSEMMVPERTNMQGSLGLIFLVWYWCDGLSLWLVFTKWPIFKIVSIMMSFTPKPPNGFVC